MGEKQDFIPPDTIPMFYRDKDQRINTDPFDPKNPINTLGVPTNDLPPVNYSIQDLNNLQIENGDPFEPIKPTATNSENDTDSDGSPNSGERSSIEDIFDGEDLTDPQIIKPDAGSKPLTDEYPPIEATTGN